MAEKVPASSVRIGDLLEEPWNGSGHRVTAVEPSVSGKIIQIRTVVEFSNDPDLWVGRPFTWGKRAVTLVWIQRAESEPFTSYP